MKIKPFFFLLIWLLCACSINQSKESNSLLPSTTPSFSPLEAQSYLVESLTSTPKSATITPLPTRLLTTTDNSFIDILEWVEVQDKELGISMQIPNNWTMLGEKWWGGDKGSVHYSTRDHAFAGPNAICQMEANKDQVYGNRPNLQLWSNNHGFYGCEIFPSIDLLNTDATLLVWYPSPVGPGFILEMTVSPRYVNPIKNNLKLWESNATGTPSTSSSYPDEGSSRTYEFYELNIQEFWVTSDEWYRKHDVEAFAGRLPEETRIVRSDLTNNWKEQIPSINNQLADFELSISGCNSTSCFNPILDFGKGYGDQQSISLLWIGNPVINQSKTQFYLPVYEVDTYRRYIVTELGVEYVNDQFFYSSLGFVPRHAFLGDDLIHLAYDPEMTTLFGASMALQVLRNEDVIFSYIVLPPNPATGAVRGLYVVDGHWYLEIADVLIRDGVVLNEELDASEIFTFHLINEKPFFFYRNNENIHLFYGGETLPIAYQHVIHEPMCCSGAMVNMTLANNSLGLYALREGNWYYVVLTTQD